MDEGQIQFESEQEYASVAPQVSASESGMVGLLLRFGLAKSKAQAQYILIGVVVVCVVIVLAVIFHPTTTKDTRPPPPSWALGVIHYLV